MFPIYPIFPLCICKHVCIHVRVIVCVCVYTCRRKRSRRRTCTCRTDVWMSSRCPPPWAAWISFPWASSSRMEAATFVIAGVYHYCPYVCPYMGPYMCPDVSSCGGSRVRDRRYVCVLIGVLMCGRTVAPPRDVHTHPCTVVLWMCVYLCAYARELTVMIHTHTHTHTHVGKATRT